MKGSQFGAIGAGAKAASDASAAYFDAEARKEVARQEVHKAAVGANAGIMHELDKTFLDYNANVGTKAKPATLSIQMSILSAYMLGVVGEKLWNDSIDATTTTYKTVQIPVYKTRMVEYQIPAPGGVGPPSIGTRMEEYQDGTREETVIDKVTRNKIAEFANNALQIRAPLTALSGEYKLGPAENEKSNQRAAVDALTKQLWLKTLNEMLL